jgi:CubicO group peptidase (beta-lactamase class C family)
MPKVVGLRFSFTAVLIGVTGVCAGQTPNPDLGHSLDAIFQKWNKPDVPGCVLGVKHPGAAPLIRSYGSADLEHELPTSESTVFEAGSVSKQFTAAAILMLAGQGALALTDDVRKYLPELLVYDSPITIEELLGHTSGLRDWGEVEALAGWPRTSRIYTLDDVLAITARQKSLNYRPGTAYSYTNTGFNLLAIIVARVSKQTLADFTHDHLFVPLGMSHTQWRDDFTRVVKGRAIAYEEGKDGYHEDMPFENAYGNGGLLTTVGDLLRWNDALSAGELGPFVTREIVRQTKLENGRAIAYARGLFIESYRGVREISHSGATAGYRAWLGRYPDQQLSVALLCNAGDANTTALARAVADQFLPAPTSSSFAGAAPLGAELLERHVGLYVDREKGLSLRLTVREGALRLPDGSPLTAASATEFTAGARTFRFSGGEHLAVESPDGSVLEYIRMQPWHPSAKELASFAGAYRSDEALATYDVQVRDGRLVMTPVDRRGYSMTLKPLATDIFEIDATDDGLVRFNRGGAKDVGDLEMSDSRVYSLRFRRQ